MNKAKILVVDDNSGIRAGKGCGITKRHKFTVKRIYA